MERNNKKGKSKLFSFLVASSSIVLGASFVGAGAVVALYFTTDIFKQRAPQLVDQTNNGKLVSYAPENSVSVSWSANSSLGAQNDVNKTWIIYDSFSSQVRYPDNTTKDVHFFSEKELEKLHHIILDRLDYGPEIYDLKRISFNNTDILEADVNGQYIPSTHEIFISVKNYIALELNFEQKVDAVLPTIYHEYFHHFANSYLQNENVNLNKTDGLTPTLLDSINVSGNDVSSNKVQWNSNFINKFQSSLSYTNTAANGNLILSGNISFTCLCGFASASHLYRMANDVNYSNDLIATNNMRLVASPSNLTSNNDSVLYRASQLAYYYSQSELVPREYQKMAYVPIYNSQNFGNTTQNAYGTRIGASNIASDTYFEDWGRSTYIFRNANNEMLFNRNQNITNPELTYFAANNVFGGTLTTEQGTYAFEDRYNDLYEAYLDALGYTNEINQVYFLNNSTVFKNATTKSLSPSNFEEDNFYKLRFSGYLTREKANKYKGLVLSNNGSYVVYPMQYINHNATNSTIKASDQQLLPNSDNLLKLGDLTFRTKNSPTALTKNVSPLSSNYLNNKDNVNSTISDSQISTSDFVAYITDINAVPKSLNRSVLYFWDDKNENNSVEPDELFAPEMNNKSRLISSYRRTFDNFLGAFRTGLSNYNPVFFKIDFNSFGTSQIILSKY
ncbi:hypothetical protein EI74_0756 [Mycoplasma testudineum]|uniref:Uncharacterized protein n=1 Tax=Mycoplasma testudineum TaxID=244584 RepID=A0A4R6IB18_9MOLU|nr:hypothetical protein [Mycoplasma testudineum]OYD26549.1 hypothetical protein CG473_03510 [Mycoplasma testudineum]TDO19112.1 hypothetical protein EI74_0756 [Mycoplasma testudineum]